VTNRRGLSRAILLTSIPCILTAAVATTATALPVAASAVATPAGLTTTSPRTSPATLAAPDALTSLGTGVATAPSAVALGAITGIVRGADGTPLRGACVTATGPTGAVSGLTGAGGTYVIRGLRLGAYTVSYSDCAQPARYFDQWYGGADLAARAARVIVSAGQPTALSPVTLRLTSPSAAVAAAQRSAAQRSAGPAGTPDSVSGTVRTKSGRRLANMCVSAWTSTSESGFFTAALTGRRGGYAMPIGTSGKWTVEFSGGCGNPGNYAPQWWRHAATGAKVTRLQAGPGRSFSGVDASLVPGAAISGTVRAAGGAGQALSGVCVQAAGLGAMSQVEVQAVTRANGSYVLRDLGTGRYRVWFTPDCGQGGNFLSATYGRTVAATDGKTAGGIDGVLPPGGAISGVVTSQAGGTAVAGICVYVQSGGNIAGRTTGKSGTYSVRRMEPGRYEVAFTGGCGNSGSYAPQYYAGEANAAATTPVTISAGQVRTGISAAMSAGGTITGQVTSKAGASLPGVCVLLTSKNTAGGVGQIPFLLALEAGQSLGALTAGTDLAVTVRSGRFSATNLTPGLYSAEFSGGCGDGSDRYAAQLFTPQGGPGPNWVAVTGGTVTAGISAVLRPGGTISGVITGAAGRPLSGACAAAVSRGSAGPVPPLFAALSRRGAYQITGLATGQYAVQFSPCEGQADATQWYRGKATEASAKLVPVRAGHATTRINGALNRGGTIAGRIVSGISRRPVAGACVFVTTSAGTIVTAGISGRSGQFEIPNVAAGRWTLEPSLCLSARPALAGVVRRHVSVRDTPTATRVTITLPRAGRITGTVLGGTPAAAEPGICVEATPMTGVGESQFALTGANGRYTMPGLARGTYRVLFTPLCPFGTAALVPQWFSGKTARSAATPVTVAAGKTTVAIGGTLAADGGISGTVTGASDAAVAGVCVGAYAGTSRSPAAIASTGGDGSYQLAGLSPGGYTVEFSPGCGAASYAIQWYSGGSARAQAAPVTVTAGSVTPGINAG
jgi:hypothetical protein